MLTQKFSRRFILYRESVINPNGLQRPADGSSFKYSYTSSRLYNHTLHSDIQLYNILDDI